MTTIQHVVDDLKEIDFDRVDAEQLAQLVVQLRAITAQASRIHLSGTVEAAAMTDRLRHLALQRKAAGQARDAAAADVEAAQNRLDEAVVIERRVLDERAELICGLSRMNPPVPVTRIARAADLTRSRVYRILAEVQSHPDTCPCKEPL
jgi:hypothetical protein